MINSWIDHDRDYLFTYAGLRQIVDKYLVQDRSSNQVFETPQYMYMLIAVTLFQEYKPLLELHMRYYDAIKNNTRINIPTPHLMAGVRHLYDNLLAVFLLMLMTPSIASSAVTWLLVTTLLKGLVSVSTQVESVGSTLKSETEKYSTQVLYRSSKV